MIDWYSDQTNVLLNPRMPEKQRIKLESIHNFSEKFKGHVWLCTSGSTAVKLVALSKEAILISASAVNTHLQSKSSDIWLNPLPIFHVGGLGVIARGHLNGAKVIPYSAEWDPKDFHKALKENSATLTALVPTQLYDLIQANYEAPPTLRAIVVGGGGLSPHLLKQALHLGWKVLQSYGMTETASQIATASLDSNEEYSTMQILPHMDVWTTNEGRICIQSRSLLSAYAHEKKEGWEIIDPKKDGTFLTEDVGSVAGNTLKIIGRYCDFIKIGGESVHLLRLEHLLEDIKLKNQIEGDLALVPVPDERLGHVIHLAVAGISPEALKALVSYYDTHVMPFEKIRKVHLLQGIPRSAMGKLLKNDLLQALTKF